MIELVSDYIHATEFDASDKRKTKKFQIISNSSGAVLGWIGWYGAWRQYVFNPCNDTLFNHGCLDSISDFLVQLNEMQRANREKK